MAKSKAKDETAAVLATPKIYVFRAGSSAAGYTYTALAEDGALLLEHVAGDDRVGQHDLGVTSELQHEKYSEHYPDGFEVVWLEHPSDDAGWKAATEKQAAPVVTDVNQAEP